ncbi:MAG: Mur ligase family protein, partial [Gammaproteobacteria bacterium]|nr:Mur ligase family protein [Gammaproteobacteria bacterium]
MQPLLTTPQEAVNWLKQHGCHQLTLDSRQIGRGHAFVAILGKKYDGRKMLPEAQAKGALAALLEAQAIEPLLSSTPLSEALPCALYRGIAQDLAQIACLFYDHPSDKLEAILAVTGTNGKTSIAWWLHQAFFALGKPCAYIGTLGMCLEQMTVDATKPNSLTTPDSVSLQTMLFELVHKKIKYCALEASSIALEQGRILGTQIKIAIFTNLTHDHLDYHGDLATYFSAKKRLFQQTGIQHAVVNIDDPWGMKLMQELKAESRIKVVSFGFHPQADYQLTQVIANPQTAGYKFS